MFWATVASESAFFVASESHWRTTSQSSCPLAFQHNLYNSAACNRFDTMYMEDAVLKSKSDEKIKEDDDTKGETGEERENPAAEE